MTKSDPNGRPAYAPVPDLQPRLDEKAAALDARLRLIEKQEAEQLARFGPAPEPKAAQAERAADKAAAKPK